MCYSHSSESSVKMGSSRIHVALRNRKYYIAICEWWIDHQDVDGKHVDKLLFDQWPSTTTYWVSLSLGLQRWGKIFSELLLLFTWFFAAITFRVESVKEWVVINPKKLLDFADLSHWSCRYFAKRWGCYKVHIFWEGHKNLQNLPNGFDVY